ncbi:MAG: hypothetical protein AAGF78_03985 [Pseudomonadota bacterium]
MAIKQNQATTKSRVSERRERLKMQRQRADEMAAEAAGVELPTAAPEPESEEKGGLPQVLARHLNGPGSEKMQGRQKMLLKLYKIMSQKSGDDAEMIKGTPFTKEGVAAMMDMLRKRAANEGAKGAAMAGGFINFLKPQSDDQPAVSGASVDKLKLLSRIVAKAKLGD